MSDWQPIETVPNDVFDVLAKYYDAGLDRFLSMRFAGCVQVSGRILWGSVPPMDLIEHGYRPTHWMALPKMPDNAEAEKGTTK